MSIQTRYSCPKCGHTVSHYSKKGFESLHTNIGISLLECKNCHQLIRTGHKPYIEMLSKQKKIEILKISVNILIISLLFGTMLGTFLGWFVNEYLLGSTEHINFYVISLMITAIIIRKAKSYMNWVKWTNKYSLEKGKSILSDQYNHPDW